MPFQVLHDQERGAALFAHVIERTDVRMVELGDRAGFAIEAVAELRISGEGVREDLDRHRAIETCVAGFVHFAHAAGAESGEDFVRAEAGAGSEGQTAGSIAVSVAGTRSILCNGEGFS